MSHNSSSSPRRDDSYAEVGRLPPPTPMGEECSRRSRLYEDEEVVDPLRTDIVGDVSPLPYPNAGDNAAPTYGDGLYKPHADYNAHPADTDVTPALVPPEEAVTMETEEETLRRSVRHGRIEEELERFRASCVVDSRLERLFAVGDHFGVDMSGTLGAQPVPSRVLDLVLRYSEQKQRNIAARKTQMGQDKLKAEALAERKRNVDDDIADRAVAAGAAKAMFDAKWQEWRGREQTERDTRHIETRAVQDVGRLRERAEHDRKVAHLEMERLRKVASSAASKSTVA